MTNDGRNNLSGLAVLLVEDEFLIALDAENMLKGLEAERVQIASTYDEALRCVQEEEFDIAILDVNLNGKLSFPLGDVLKRRSRPFVFATGYNLGRLEDKGASAIYITKPYDHDRLKAALMQALGNAG